MGTIYRDVDINESEQTGYDLYLPESPDPDQDYSLILYIHGGGFTSGDKADGDQLCKYYTSKGYVCASVNYTLSDGEHTSSLNLMYNQICEQVDLIINRCQEMGYNVTEMATTGESAGGCLAMLYAYRDPEKWVVPVKLVFQMTGPAAFDPELWGAADTETAMYFTIMMSGKLVSSEMMENGEAQEIINAISPAHLVNEDTVPTVIAYGPKDKVVPVDIKYKLMDAFEEYGVTYEYIEFSNSGHTMALDPDKSQKYVDTVQEYLDRYFDN